MDPNVCQYGKCFECGDTNSGSNWCSKCEIDFLRRNFSKWTSGNVNIDLIIQKTQTTAFGCVDYLEWIPFENFDFVKYHARGAFSVIYSSVWMEGPRHIFDSESQDWVRNGPTKCALKRIENSQSMCQEYLDNIYINILPKPWDVFAGMAFLNSHHHQKLAKKRDVIDMLWGIVVGGLEPIHENGFFHGNLHGGNLLVEEHPESINVKISDIGLHGPADSSASGIYGVLPYIAPEVLRGKKYTQECDIYSFGIIMWAMSSFVPPFCHIPHDLDLATLICDGLRPSIIDGTPEVYVTLMERCWHQDPSQRPKVSELNEILTSWMTAISDDPDPSPTSEQFDIAEEKRFSDLINKTFPKPKFHNQAVYISRLLNYKSLYKNTQ
ncbi:2726_t:CDS:2, partial [Racocetra fulgida]